MKDEDKIASAIRAAGSSIATAIFFASFVILFGLELNACLHH